MKSILYTAAMDKNGSLVKADTADKGHTYYCTLCKKEVILRKSGNTAKNSKRPHFAHQVLTPNCTPETALHFAFKNLLLQKIDQHLINALPLLIKWDCTFCEQIHSGNLLKKIKTVVIEHNMVVCQPDIALIDSTGKVFAVIEIVVTHKPEAKVLQYYKDNNIILIQINLTSDQDIYDIDGKIAQPSIVHTCFNPKCQQCGSYQHKTIMTIADASCWKCGKTMKVAFMRIAGSTEGPGSFTKEQVNFARGKGTLIETHYSNVQRDRYLANTCPHCKAFIGEHYLFTDYAAPAAYEEIPSQSFEIGYHCEACTEAQKYDDTE